MAAYAWLDKGITVPDSPQAEALLKAIDQKDWDGFLKNVYLRCGLERLAHGKPVSPKSVASWKNTKEFHEILAASVNDAKGKFQICGVMIVMMATLVFFFINAVMRGLYVVNFSVDALVGVAALVFLIHNLRIKYRLVRSLTKSRDYLYLDILSALLSGLLKIMLPANLDFSLFVFMVSYFVQKRKFDQLLQQTIKY